MRKYKLTPLAFMASALLIASAEAFSLHLNTLEIRQSSCPTNFKACGSSGFPSNFCCPSDNTCVTLASNTTLLCCPPNGDCSRINPITCDLSLEDAEKNPESTIKTTNLDGKLAVCGTQCCPFGYSCSSNICQMDQDQKLLAPPKSSSSSSTSPLTSSAAPPSSSASPTTPPDPTSDPASPTMPPDPTSDPATPTTPTSSDTAPPSETPTTTPAAIPLGGSSPSSTCSNFPAPAVLAGFFPGMLAGILGAIACFCLLGARRRKAPKISSPSCQGTDFRTDFVRRYQPSSTATSLTQTNRPATGMMRVKSLFRKPSSATSRLAPATPQGLGMGLPTTPQRPPLPTSTTATATASGAAAAAAPPPPPVTPRLQRELSMESINIFADPSTAGSGGGSFQMAERRRTAHTTFAEMMERAQLGDVRDGAPFVPPGLPEPRLSPATYSPARNGSPVRGLVPGGSRRSP